MINDLKLGFKVIPYGLNFKGSIVSYILFFILGLVMEITSPDMGLGVLYVAIGSLLVVQLINSITCSTMVQTSPYKKRLQTVIPCILGGGYLLVTHTLVLGAKWIGFQANFIDLEEAYAMEEAYANSVIMSSVMLILVVVYMAAALKRFWVSTVIFIVVFIGLFSTSTVSRILGDNAIWFTMEPPVAIALSYAMVLIGVICMYVISRILYKKDFSKVTFETALKRMK